MDLLARREHSTQEVVTQLTLRAVKRLESGALVHHVVAELGCDGLLSNERFAASMARQLVARGSGPVKLTYELRQKGCDPESAVASAFPDGIDWFSVATDVYERKFGSKPVPDDWESRQKERAKRGRFMASRGFSPSHFMHLLEAMRVGEKAGD